MDNEKPTLMLFDHCVRVYDRMALEAQPMEVDGIEGTIMVYEGHLTKLFQSLELPGPYYTSIMKNLTTMDCVAQLRRGGGAALSRWIIKMAPTEQSFASVQSMRRAPQGKYAVLEQQVRDLHRRVTDLERSAA